MSTRMVLACDFETTVYESQTDTEVWAAACVEIGTEDVIICHSIDEFFDHIFHMRRGVTMYFHNLKFDGSFIIPYLRRNNWTEALYDDINPETNEVIHRWCENSEMPNHSYKYLISGMGQWYSITIKYHGLLIEIRDSLKLMPFTIAKLGHDFKTKHQKLEMEYTGLRFPGCEITQDERNYIANDVLVLKECLEIMLDQGYNKLTIGACCMSEFKHGLEKGEYKKCFPDLSIISVPDPESYGSENADQYIRRAYRGGWCYLVEEKAHQRYVDGITCDVNSLYPSMMHSESGNYFPIGEPHFFKGTDKFLSHDIIELLKDKYYYLRVKCRFYLKPGKLPFIQIKHSVFYKHNECLRTSDIYNYETGEFEKSYENRYGDIEDASIIMTVSCTDWQLIQDHYDLEDVEILDGVWFDRAIGIFDRYINRYRKIKMESKGAQRTIAKLFLNNLYGKFATSTDSTFKYFTDDDNGIIRYNIQIAHDKTPGYIAIGAAITSYARNFTIRAAQMNYHGDDQPGFIYADTDSMHISGIPADQVRGINIDANAFCCWKIESSWDEAYFTRQKTYIEHITHHDLEKLDEPYYDVKCAGMPDTCKSVFIRALNGDTGNPDDKTQTRKFLAKKKYCITDFDYGLKIYGKLKPMQMASGTLLVESWYELRRN